MSRRSIRTLTVVASLITVAATNLRAAQSNVVYDEEIRLNSFVDLKYPSIAQAARIQGVVVVAATLSDSGKVVSVDAISGPRVLVPAASENLKQWTFQPNSKRRVVVIFEFRVNGTCHDSTGSVFRLRSSNVASITACVPIIEG